MGTRPQKGHEKPAMPPLKSYLKQLLRPCLQKSWRCAEDFRCGTGQTVGEGHAGRTSAAPRGARCLPPTGPDGRPRWPRTAGRPVSTTLHRHRRDASAVAWASAEPTKPSGAVPAGSRPAPTAPVGTGMAARHDERTRPPAFEFDLPAMPAAAAVSCPEWRPTMSRSRPGWPTMTADQMPNSYNDIGATEGGRTGTGRDRSSAARKDGRARGKPIADRSGSFGAVATRISPPSHNWTPCRTGFTTDAWDQRVSGSAMVIEIHAATTTPGPMPGGGGTIPPPPAAAPDQHIQTHPHGYGDTTPPTTSALRPLRPGEDHAPKITAPDGYRPPTGGGRRGPSRERTLVACPRTGAR
ncbi:hypothetical protein FRACA_530033 [Frankia canadensis]|uniref:Uncharacterized protein n=1 Tax=Frankia canadensis TaxID=1836972 RepID=A0A2I2KYS7_9ACTN|nr:hypothetical protein FRACA_530033 [Frankia canadensis]SOU58100.1 hypothetical protein FRACA_530033 [Frankia canadensis]